MYSVIKTKEQYQEYLKRFEELFNCEEDTLEEQDLELLGLIIDNYEKVHYPMPESHPVETIKFVMEQMGLTRTDLAKILNSASRATELLYKQRRLSLSHIRKINASLHIPAETLIKKYDLAQ